MDFLVFLAIWVFHEQIETKNSDEPMDQTTIPSGLPSHILLAQAVRQKRVVTGYRERSAMDVFLTSISWALLVVCVPLTTSAQEEGPKYYECIERDAFSSVILYPDGKARFLAVRHNQDKTTWFYFDESATWGVHEGQYFSPEQVGNAPFIWVKTYDKDGERRYRYDYFQMPDKLVEYDKTGIRQELMQRINMADVLKWK